MYFSYREKKILKLLIQHSAGIPLANLSRLLNVSNRTIYRELSSIESSLAHSQIKLVKKRTAGYRLVGETVFLKQLQENLARKDNVLDSTQRQSAIACQILLSDEEIKMESLAIDFNVSITTIHSDLKIIEEIFEDFQIRLKRKKSRGIGIEVSEEVRRQLLSGLINSETNEYSFFQFISKSAQINETDELYFLHFIAAETLFVVYQALAKETNYLNSKMDDSRLQQIIIFLAVTIDRVKQGHFIKKFQNKKKEDFELYSTAEKIMVDLKETTHLEFPENEIFFFSVQLGGINYQVSQNIFLESFDVELSFRVKALIGDVSDEFHWDFRQDEMLYHDLLTHISAALKRLLAPIPEMNNPLLEKIKKEYQELYQITAKNLNIVFKEDKFSLNEVAYIVIHFAAALERSPIQKNLSFLVVCPSGIGTSKMLESRIRKFLPEVETIKISRISNLNKIDYKAYDMILSTVFLPGFRLEYKLISPLLMEKEIQEIKTYIQQAFPNLSSIQEMTAKNEQKIVPATTPIEFEELYQAMKMANTILENFDLKDIQRRNSVEETILEICAVLEGSILEKPEEVARTIIERYQMAPLGIPNTNYALFHGVDKNIKTPFFSIYELSSGYEIESIEHTGMQLKRILLMIGPDPLSEMNKEFLGRISESIVESDLNMEIYKTGTRDIIYKLLSKLFVEELKKINEDKAG